MSNKFRVKTRFREQKTKTEQFYIGIGKKIRKIRKIFYKSVEKIKIGKDLENKIKCFLRRKNKEKNNES